MSEYKHTDEDIIKALECCINADCLNCPQWSDEWYSGMCNDFLKSVLDLINRKNAEIERLKKYNTDVAFKYYNDGIREFAERVVNLIYSADDINPITEWQIDNIVTEMTEGK